MTTVQVRESPAKNGHQKTSRADHSSKLRIGTYAFGALIVIKIVEFVVGVSITRNAWPLLAVLAIIGAWPILRYFMRIDELKRPEE